MKHALTTALLLLGVSALHAAKDEKMGPIPREKEGRYGIYSFAEAKEEAMKKKQPIALIVQNERSEEMTEKDAVLRSFWGLQKEATMVMVTSRLMNEAKHRLSHEAYEALTSTEVGKELPRLAVMSADGTVALGVMNKEQILATDEKGFKDFARKMSTANKSPTTSAVTLTPAGGAKPAPATATPAASPGATPAAAAGPVAIKNPQSESWTNAEGRAIQAALIEVNGSQITFQMANGTKVPFELSKLSPASQKRVQELVTASK